MLIRTMNWNPCLDGHYLFSVGEPYEYHGLPNRYMCKCLFCGRAIIVVIPERNTVQELTLSQELEDFIRGLFK